MNKMITAKDIQAQLKVGKSYAYKTISDLNKELERKGYMTCKGRVPEKYFKERFNLS